MHVDIVEDVEGEKPVLTFPPVGNYLDLRENSRAVEQVAAARKYVPFRNFLAAVNGPASLFAPADAETKSDSPAAVSAGLAYEFASETNLVFADLALNFERKRYLDLSSSLKELLERDSADSVRVVLRISSCDFQEGQDRRGFCLGIRLVAVGDSAEQAELRWGLALARVQQALLFRARAIKLEVGG